jgi:very-short-patch-repair endonuclease
VNFYCPAVNLVIECDGSQHFTNEGLEADRVRDEALAQLGLKVLRFDNGQVIEQLDNVVEVIYQFIQQESP